MPLIIPANSITGGFAVDNSLRFNSGSSDYLTVANPTAGNRKTGTLSFWIKICKLSTHYIYNTYNSGASGFSSSYIQITSAGRIEFINYQASGGNHSQVSTNRLFRDFSAWYHFVIAWDTTQSTASDRVKIYVNGTQETSLSNTDYPTLNEDLFFDIGGTSNPRLINYAFTNYGDNYLAEMVYVNGTALTPTSFGEFDEDSSIWKPIDVSGLTFGNEGFYLDFENSGSLGADVSGNGNNFTVNNLTSIDQTTDTCTNNFATFNPLVKTASQPTFSEGNLKIAITGNWNSGGFSSIGLSSGKWYWEAKAVSGNNTNIQIGVGTENINFNANVLYSETGTLLYETVQGRYLDGSYTSSVFGLSYGNGDIIGVALDLDSGTKTITFTKNGTSMSGGTQNLSSNFNNSFIFPMFIGSNSSASAGWEANFGSPPFAISSGNTDGNGYGNFEYAVPSGYLSLCTKNLSEVLG
jgi:hypothetical protein